MHDLGWLPNLLIAGAPKAGTSSVQRWIADHPDALGSREKETYFLVDPGTHMHNPDHHIANGLKTWKSQFDVPTGMSPKVIVESTPGYLYSATALETVPDLQSAPKCLFLLREPAAQIHSLFTYFRENWTWIPSDMDFATFLTHARNKSHEFNGNELARDAMENARYIEFLERWADKLGPDRIMVDTFDSLQRDPEALLRRVAEWVGLETTFYDTYDFPRENETYVPRNRALQALNVRLRGALPKGALYNGLRALYRRLNTTKRAAPELQEAELIRALAEEFAEPNRRLAARFNLDLDGWAT